MVRRSVGVGDFRVRARFAVAEGQRCPAERGAPGLDDARVLRVEEADEGRDGLGGEGRVGLLLLSGGGGAAASAPLPPENAAAAEATPALDRSPFPSALAAFAAALAAVLATPVA